MKFIVDAQLPPALARYLVERFNVQASHVRDVGLRDADDASIHRYARQSSSIVVTKDSDFVELVHRHGVPPQVVWVTCGNTTNSSLQRIFDATFANAIQLLTAGETVGSARPWRGAWVGATHPRVPQWPRPHRDAARRAGD